MIKRVTPIWITKLKVDEVFVFASNQAGRHSAQAAKMAIPWGAEYGVGYGLRGHTFAIPTKDKKLRVLPLDMIEIYVEGFIAQAKQRRELKFLVTPIGAGRMGLNYKDVAMMFEYAIILENIWLPDKFWKHLKK